MVKRIVFRSMDHSDFLENHVNEQLSKIERFLSHSPEPVVIDVFLEPSRVHAHHRVEIRIKTPYFSRSVHKEDHEFALALDHALDVMYRLLLQDKERRIDHLKDVGRHEDFKKQR